MQTLKVENLTYQLPKLPYAQHALEPYISGHLISFHYGKHHQGYVTKYNELVAKTPYADHPLEKVIQETFKNPEQKTLFNNAAQIFNHTFFWHSMKPKGGGEPHAKTMSAIQHTWGTFEKFKSEFTDKATNLFGSGWVWLVKEGDTLSIIQTKNAETPITNPKQKPLITLDVWEHAYYLDYQNKRPEFIKTYLEHLINWDFAEKNL
jgi:Fe-Mn family superoxide dismutase